MACIARGARTAALTSPSSEELKGTRSRETGSGAGLTRLLSQLFGPDEPGTPVRLRQVSVQPQSISTGLRCVDPRCGTRLSADAEVCDECGGTALAPIADALALLLGDAGDRPVAFALHSGQPNVLGRSSPGGGLDIDVARFRGSESVHRRHAQFDERQGQWSVTHLGRNPIVLARPEGTIVVQPGSSAALRSGDWLQIGRIRLQLIVDPARGI